MNRRKPSPGWHRSKDGMEFNGPGGAPMACVTMLDGVVYVGVDDGDKILSAKTNSIANGKRLADGMMKSRWQFAQLAELA